MVCLQVAASKRLRKWLARLLPLAHIICGLCWLAVIHTHIYEIISSIRDSSILLLLSTNLLFPIRAAFLLIFALVLFFYHIVFAVELFLTRFERFFKSAQRLSERCLGMYAMMFLIICVLHLSLLNWTRLEQEFQDGFKEGFRQYNRSDIAMVALNQMQANLGCCGYTGLHDYYQPFRISDELSNFKFSLCETGSCFPVSCCRTSQCQRLLDPKHVSKFLHETLHQKGCREAFFENRVSAIPGVFFILVPLVLQVLTAPFVSLLYTSNALLDAKGLDADDPVEGYMFPFLWPTLHVVIKEMRREAVDDQLAEESSKLESERAAKWEELYRRLLAPEAEKQQTA